MSLIVALQLPTLPMSEAKLDYYFRICAKKGATLVVLGDYVLNSFFKELETMPTGMIKEQTNHKIESLKRLCHHYGLSVIAPLVLVKKEGLVKVTAKFTPKSTHFYPQQLLINFKHWNEEKFYLNEESAYELPVFVHEGLRCAIVNGFELHFDPVWTEIDRKKVDVVLMPSVSAFDSSVRWNELLRSRAFTHNVYILRVNRIGSYKEGEHGWHFYGNSSLTNANGDTELVLGDKEEMLVASIDKTQIQEARRAWGWRGQLVKKGFL